METIQQEQNPYQHDPDCTPQSMEEPKSISGCTVIGKRPGLRHLADKLPHSEPYEKQRNKPVDRKAVTDSGVADKEKNP